MQEVEDPHLLVRKNPWRKNHVRITIPLACLTMANQIKIIGMVWLYVGYHCDILEFIQLVDHEVALAATLVLP